MGRSVWRSRGSDECQYIATCGIEDWIQTIEWICVMVGNQYFNWLSCTHVIQRILTILPKRSTNLETGEQLIIQVVGRMVTAKNRNHEQYKSNQRVWTGNEEKKSVRTWEDIWEVCTREIGNDIQTWITCNWPKIPLQVYTESPPPTFLRKGNNCTVLCITLCILSIAPNIAISTNIPMLTVTNTQRPTWNNNITPELSDTLNFVASWTTTTTTTTTTTMRLDSTTSTATTATTGTTTVTTTTASTTAATTTNAPTTNAPTTTTAPTTTATTTTAPTTTSAKCKMVWKSQLNNSATLNSHTDPSRCSQMLPDRLSAKRWALRCSETTSPVLLNVLEVVEQNTRISWRMYGCLRNATKSNY